MLKKKMIYEWLMENYDKNFPRPLFLFLAITLPTDLQIG